MIFIKILLIFLLGFAFCQWIAPILDELQALLLSWIETKKGTMAIQIAEINLKAQEIADKKSSKNTKTQAIGFQISEEEEEEDDYEDDE